MSAEDSVPSFAPDDPTDGRLPGDWKTRYTDEKAVKKIRFEALYLAAHLAGVVALIVFLASGYPGKHGLDEVQAGGLTRYSFAWLGGTLGGTLLDIKWLYHSVARNLWNEDRRLWRLFIPHISGAFAFAIALLISSGIFKLFDPGVMNSGSAALAVGFLVGYFSDSAAAKMAEVADTVFGTTRPPEGGKRPKGSGRAAAAAGPVAKGDPD